MQQIYEACVPEQLERIRTWILSYLEDRDALRAGGCPEAFQEADFRLLNGSEQAFWRGLWTWTNPLWETSEGVLQPSFCMDVTNALFYRIPLGLYRMRERFKNPLILQRWREVREPLDILRQRLRWLVILADGLERSPLWVASGQQQPRRTKRHIVHSAQTHADALNEVAGKLVHPPKRYVAHVRQPQQYHQVKLRPPLEGESFSAVVDLVRERSQRLYMRRERLAEDPAPNVHINPLSPPVTRRPPEPPDQPPQDEPTD